MSKRQSSQRRCILCVTHYYPPETNTPAVRISELARLWSAAGRRVEVITGMPSHPHGVIPAAYKGAWYRREEHDGVVVHRGRIYPAANRGRVRRILNYLSFLVSAFLTGIIKVRRVRCVVATSPQLFCALAGWLLAVTKGVPFVFEVRDLWPAEIVAVGAIRNRLVIRLLEVLETFLYRRAARIIAVAQGTVEILAARGIPADKIALVPNGVDTHSFAPGPRHNWVRDTHNLNGDLLVSYVGTVGMAHRLEVMLDAAFLLKDEPKIRFMVVGDGAERDRLQRITVQRGLSKVIWEAPQPRNRVAAYYQASDLCLVHLRRADLFTKNIPSKMYEIMSCGRPMLLGTEGESRRLGLASGGAATFCPENGHDLARAIRELARDPRRREELGRAGREFVVPRYDRRRLAVEYLRILDRLPDAHGAHTG